MSHRIVSVSAASQPLLADVPDIVESSVISSTLHNKSTTTTLLESFFNSIYIQARLAYDYGATEYFYGLPNTVLQFSPAAAKDEIKTILESIEGTTIEIFRSVYSLPDAELLCRDFLQNTRGWDLATNVVSTPPFTPPVGASDVTFHEAAFTSVSEQIKITYEYTYDPGSGGETYYVTELITVTGTAPSGYFYHVEYFLTVLGVPTGDRLYWFYAPSTNLYPSLDVDETDLQSPHFPIVPIRINNVDLTREEVREDEAFLSAQKLLSKLNIDYISLGDSVNDNPEVAEIDHAYFYQGIDLHTERTEGIRYLWEYFRYLSTVVAYDFVTYTGRDITVPPVDNVITVADEQLIFNIRFHYIEVTTLPLVIGPVGTVTRTTTVLAPVSYGAGDPEDSGYYSYDLDESYVTFDKQVTATTVSRIKVQGLVHENQVYNHFKYGNPYVVTTIADSVDPDNYGFVLPLNKHVVDSIPFSRRSALIYESITIIFNSFKVTKLEWYQTPEFAFAIKVLAIVIIIYSLGKGFKVSAALVAATNYTVAVIVTVLIQIAEAYVLARLASYVVKELGLENSFLGAVILTAVAVYGLATGQVWATNMLRATAAVIGGTQMVIADAMEDLMSEYQDFSLSSAAKTEELEQAQSLLETSDTLDPLDLFARIEPRFVYESPTDFYNRTIHAGNVGVLSLDYIESYVDLALQLPRDVDSILA